MKNVSVGGERSHSTHDVGKVGHAPARSFLILLGAVLLIAALWSYMAFRTATPQTLDQHVQSIGAQLKCPVCQGESVADSPSDRAQQMRGVIRQQLQAGASDRQIIQFFSERYGEQVVWAPQWWGFSLLTWIVPLVLLLGGLVLIAFTLRDWRTPAALATGRGQGDVIAQIEEGEFDEVSDTELAQYRAQLERELVAEDALFQRPVRGARRSEAL